MTTHDHIIKLEPHEVFVFGSNWAGRHGKGASLTAVRKFGARHGQGTGLMGQSYGIATKDHKLQVLPLHTIQIQVNRFIRFAISHPHLEFLITPIGCGLAGYSPKDIAPMFKIVPPNVRLNTAFLRELGIQRGDQWVPTASPGQSE